MATLVILSIFSLAMIFQRALVIKMDKALPSSVLREIASFKPGSSTERFKKVLQSDPSPLSRVLTTLIQHKDWPRAEVLDAVQTRARHEISRLESGLIFLEITTGISPLLGLLGTLSGLVGIFGNLGDHGEPQMVANGISEALNCTIVGLGVAVPNLIAYNYFTRRVEVISIELESQATELMAKLGVGKKSIER